MLAIHTLVAGSLSDSELDLREDMNEDTTTEELIQQRNIFAVFARLSQIADERGPYFIEEIVREFAHESFSFENYVTVLYDSFSNAYSKFEMARFSHSQITTAFEAEVVCADERLAIGELNELEALFNDSDTE